MAGQTGFNVEDAESLLNHLRQFHKAIQQECHKVDNRYKSLTDVWHDNQFKTFEPFYKKLSATYAKVDAACDEYITYLQGEINIARQRNEILGSLIPIAMSIVNKSFSSNSTPDLGQQSNPDTVSDIVNNNKTDFGKYLRRLKGDPPKNMPCPHAHHILYKRGRGKEQQELVKQGQRLLRIVGIDPIWGTENLTWAPNTVAGQHSVKDLRSLVKALKDVEKFFDDGYDEMVVMLELYGQTAAQRR